MKQFVTRTTILAIVSAMASAALAEEAAPGPKFEFHGFVGASLYGQDAQMNNNGQAAWYVKGTPATDKLQVGGDVRQSRLNFSLAAGSKVLGATPKAVVEFDFFNNNGPGAFGDVSLLPRLRLVYADLAWANSVLRVGQDHELVLGILPATIGHAAFPLTYTCGTIGWRQPGIAFFQTFPMGDFKLEAAVQVTSAPGNAMQLDFPGTSTGIGATGINYGEASGLPAVEARVKLSSKMMEVFVAGHWSRIDRNGVGVVASDAEVLGNDQDIVAGNIGFRVAAGPVTVQGSGYTGKNLAPLLGEILQTTPRTKGDVHEWGAWGQAGLNFTPELSLWGLAGTGRPNYSEVRAQIGASGILQNSVYSGMLRYQLKGYTLGFEYTHWYTKYDNVPKNAANAAPTIVAGTESAGLHGNQLMFSGYYLF